MGLRGLTDGHLRRHLEYFKTLNDARVASVGFIKYNASTTRINKEKTLKSSSRSFWFSTGLFIKKTIQQKLFSLKVSYSNMGSSFEKRSDYYKSVLHQSINSVKS